MTAPTSAPMACTLPPRTFSATSGLPSIAASTAATSSSDSPRTARPRASHHLRRVALAGEDAVERLPGQLVVDRAGGHEPDQLGDLRRGHGELGQLDAGVVRAPGQLAQPPLAGVGR